MDGPGSSHLSPDADRTPSDAAMLHAMAVAHEAGLSVTVKPQIGIRSGSWIGGAHPADLDAFWNDYTTMLLHYADLAEQGGATMLVVGTEMRTLSWDEARWRRLIAEVRARFHGQLTYAANYDEYDSVPFWDALDYIGIDGYFALASADSPAPPVADLVQAWQSRGYLSRLAAVSERAGKKVIFTEIGYRGGHTAAVHPNVWDIVDQTDVQAQANLYEAFYRAVADQPWVAGFYWWEVNTDGWWVQDYNPLGKPAEQVMADWNRRVRPAGSTQSHAVPPNAEPGQQPAAPARVAMDISVRGRRLRGLVSGGTRACGGRISLRLRRRAAGRWRYVRPPAPFAASPGGGFAHRLPPGRLRVRAVLQSRCGRASSGWVTTH
jgi:hypothetical protein